MKTAFAVFLVIFGVVAVAPFVLGVAQFCFHVFFGFEFVWTAEETLTAFFYAFLGIIVLSFGVHMFEDNW